MSERTTAEIVAELRSVYGVVRSSAATEAAARLAELDAKVTQMDKVIVRWNEIDALRPPCLTCGGTGDYIVPTDRSAVTMWPCSDCKGTGRVSIEQLVATYNAVWDDARPCYDLTYRHYLRSVKP